MNHPKSYSHFLTLENFYYKTSDTPICALYDTTIVKQVPYAILYRFVRLCGEAKAKNGKHNGR